MLFGLFILLLGLCVGSFLNVVIHRLPRDESLVHPGSHCPACSRPLQWYENIPLVSYILLTARCRTCKCPIPIRYPAVEAVTGVTFLAIYDAAFVGQVISGFTHPAADWAVLLAILWLAGSLLVSSAIDIESYTIDLRITYLCALVALGLWTIQGHTTPFVPASNATWIATAGGTWIGMIAWWIVQARLTEPANPDTTPQTHPDDPAQPVQADTTHTALPSHATSSGHVLRTAGAIILLVLVILLWLYATRGSEQAYTQYPMRGIAYVSVLFVAIVIAGSSTREVDEEIVETIEEERFTARQMAMSELAGLLPAIGCGLVTWLLVTRLHSIGAAFDAAVHWQPVDNWQPILGFGHALVGATIAAAFGWCVRIVFTLVFGKEAMGQGDIHLLAAAGAAVGWTAAVVGFFAGSILALLGVLAMLMWKRSSALPFGPWISLGIFLVLLTYHPVMQYLANALDGISYAISGR